jgi:hypothetical protein
MTSTASTDIDSECVHNENQRQNLLLDVVKYYYQTVQHYPHVYSGLQFGCHYVIYLDHPQKVHSTYAIYVIFPSTQSVSVSSDCMPWYTIQTLVRMMADLHKTLIVVHISEKTTENHTNNDTNDIRSSCFGSYNASKTIQYPINGQEYTISELSITTEHAPFRQNKC